MHIGLWGFEKWVVGRIFGPKREKVAGGWRINCIMRSFKICTLHQVLLWYQLKEGGIGGARRTQ
jgi:hypothetical protein